MGQAHFPYSDMNTSTCTPTPGPRRPSWAAEDNVTASERREVTGVGISGGGRSRAQAALSPNRGAGPEEADISKQLFSSPSSTTMCLVI